MMGCHNLGFRYGNGQGVQQSWAKAKFWFKRGAALGDPSSVDHLKMMQEHGHSEGSVSVSEDDIAFAMMQERGHSEGSVSVSEEDIAITMWAFRASTVNFDAKARESRNQKRPPQSFPGRSSRGAPVL
mmetsp:Transcript_27321/g.80465  ORF Transcript_27321/g.80465 Transcript_27321/m.80465 type:complete len:128 (-) Transcript_27321:25-408(-)